VDDLNILDVEESPEHAARLPKIGEGRLEAYRLQKQAM